MRQTKQTESAKNSSEAALLNARTLVNAERAWIIVDIEWKRGGGRTIEGNSRATVGIRCTCKNQGRTPAWITEKRIGFVILKSIPESPDLDAIEDNVEYGFEPLAGGELLARDYELTGYGDITATGVIAVVYGVIRYKNIVNQECHTFFAYSVFPRVQIIERMTRYPQYNQHT